ncbi:hypothetical protein [Bradyrhizobium elkanii]|uniref:hypothetical protein n=1 Tax=Bradyrhizobium elkanii TaxID=29448 RepID=UPI003D262B6D
MSKTKIKKEKKPETLAYKQSRLNGLSGLISLHARILFPREEAYENGLKQELSDRIEFIAREVVAGRITLEEAQHREIDAKLQIFQKLIDMLKHGMPTPIDYAKDL